MAALLDSLGLHQHVFVNRIVELYTRSHLQLRPGMQPVHKHYHLQSYMTHNCESYRLFKAAACNFCLFKKFVTLQSTLLWVSRYIFFLTKYVSKSPNPQKLHIATLSQVCLLDLLLLWKLQLCLKLSPDFHNRLPD